METARISRVILGTTCGVTAASVCITIAMIVEFHFLRNQLADSRQLWTAAVTETADLRSQNASSLAALGADRERIAGLERELAELRARSSLGSAGSTQALPVRVYDGNRYVGLGWVLPAALDRSDVARNEVACVVLDRGVPGIASPAPDRPNWPDRAQAHGVSTTSSWTSYQQYPYYPYLWLAGPGDAQCTNAGGAAPMHRNSGPPGASTSGMPLPPAPGAGLAAVVTVTGQRLLPRQRAVPTVPQRWPTPSLPIVTRRAAAIASVPTVATRRISTVAQPAQTRR